ncbi:hypothetical protein [Prosthecobacter sp.]|uniref:hypothetical protein n=1 Tax=Prosthecobacter sp. TaxID=1965333 RepID=UPI003784CBEA
MRFLIALITATAIAACHKEPEKTATQLRAEIHAAAKAAEDSVKTLDKAAAEGAAKSATVALDLLRKMHAHPAQNPENIVDDALLVECETEARKVGQWAALTQEKVARSEKLAGWKAKAYYGVESASLKISFHGLALAADQAAAGNLKHLPQRVQDGAGEAAKFIESYVGPQRLASGELDWTSIGRELRKFAESPPLELRLLLVFVMAIQMDFDLAFYEIEAIPETLSDTPEKKVWYHLLRGVAYMTQGYGQLAMGELELTDKLSTEQKLNLDPSEKCCLHLLVACYFLREKRWADADRSLVAANRAWPDNPLTIYLTGERQIATHEYAAAEESFAKAMKGSGYEWLAEKVQERAKRLRDNPASLEPVVFDFKFITEVVSKGLENEAEKSESLRKLKAQMETAKTFVRDLKQKLPDVEMKMPEWKKLFETEAASASDKK